MVPKMLANRVHLCRKCGLKIDRDLNISLNIRTPEWKEEEEEEEEEEPIKIQPMLLANYQSQTR